jgi:hypothetical protein
MNAKYNITLGRANTRVPTIRYVVQITGTVVPGKDQATEKQYYDVRHLILDWVQSKCPKELPKHAFDGEDFEVDIPGHKFIATTLPDSDLWVVKIEHPSDDGCVWSVESEIATSGNSILFGVRSYRSTIGEQFYYPARSTPTFVRDIARKFTIYDGSKKISEDPWILSEEDDLVILAKFLQNPGRTLPVILVASNSSDSDTNYSIDYNYLAYKAFGLAHVALLSDNLSYKWTDLVGKEWSAFKGTVRTYYANLAFDEDDPLRHPLSTHQRILNWEAGSKIGPDAFNQFLISQLYSNSVSGAQWRSRFASFADVKARKLASISKSANDIDQIVLDSYEERIKYLTEEKEAAESLAQESEILKNETQIELTRLNSRLYYLQSQNDRLLTRIGAISDDEIEDRINIPDSLEDISEWADKFLPGRVLLHPRALRAVKKSPYENIELVYKSLLLLANEYRNMRLAATEDAQDVFEKSLSDLNLELSRSIAPSRAGEEGEEYKVRYPPGSHSTRFLELHLKNGTSRDERYCLRIYFFWDLDTSQVVVGSLPGHLSTRAT